MKKSIRILIAMLFALLVPATLVLAASPPPPPSPTPVGTPAPTPQRKVNAPTAAGQNCISSTGKGTTIQPGGHWAGVIMVTMADNSVVQAFCIDLYHNTYIGDCYVAGENPEPHVNYLMNNYPPDNSQSSEENAARQAAIWYFSDGYVITDPANIAARTYQITMTVPANPTPNLDVPTLRVTPSNVNLSTGKAYTFTLTAVRGSNPITGQVIALTTDFGTLNTNQVTTGANGTATFSISNSPNVTGTAHINASFTTQIPAGTVLDDVVPTHQRIMVGSSATSPVATNATTMWWANPTPILVATIEGYSGGPDVTPVAGGAGTLGLIALGGVGLIARQRRSRRRGQ